ncbi:MAG: phenylacetic acid degradation operon negative regulatory protein [Parcubacteria group bacterium Gr01-1014_70]|nr:MAG: phenylacetic acid degradation operon negative regulatory protein [Parcubacteria group bacterium Gr01-1014_70]
MVWKNIKKKNTDRNPIKSGWSNDLIPYLQEYENKVPISDVILGIIGIASVVSIAILAPNAVQILRFIEPDRWKKNNPTYRVNETLQRLKNEGVIMLDQTDGNIPSVKLTERGEKRFHQLRFKTENSSMVWDGKWRVVVFDVLEKRRNVRDHLRIELSNMGFRKLQNSVWIYPYECEEALALLKINLKLGHDVLYFVTEKMEGDEYVQRLFSLPPKE